MVQSMTGFGRAEKNGCRVEIRSINHRFLDVYMKLPPFLNQLEMPFRNMLKERFSRGKLDVSVFIAEQEAKEFSINTDIVKKIYEVFRKLQEELRLSGDIDINSLVPLRDMFIGTSQTYDAGEVTAIFKEALEDLYAMRAREGASLAAEIRRMAESLGILNDKVGSLCGRVLSDVRGKFEERLKEILGEAEIDGNRILQEAAIIAARLDISEEIARIESHLKQFGEILLKGGIIGRKLDFILQELNREVNTVGSKSADYELSSLTVEMKTVIEQIREQVQNIQ